jgi:glutamyl-tRNA synthetase
MERKILLKHTLLNAMQHDGKADVQAVLGKIISEDPKVRNKIKKILPEIKKIVKEVNSLSLSEQKSKFEKLGLKVEKKRVEEEKELPPLPNAKKYKKIVMRMAPFPSGPLHIGNARMALLNDEYVKNYKGRLLLVIDDTIGSEAKIPTKEAYKLVREGLKWLGVKWHKIIYKSDRMKLFYGWAEKLIKMGYAYVCECPKDVLRENRERGLECKCRKQNPKTNLKKWKKMLKGEYEKEQATVRLKTNMKHPNPAFRDRVLLRISDREHPRVGKKYHVWPMLEFSWAIDDHFLSVTHILRGKDLVMEDMMEEFIWNRLGWRHPEFIHHGMLRFEGLKLSKTQSRMLIEKKIYTGWDDPRTWSLQSLKRRGFLPEALRNFILSFGLSLNDVKVPVEILYSENRKLIDPKVNRYFAVIDPVQIKVVDAPKVKKVRIHLHPDFPRRGFRDIPVNNNIFISREDFDKFKGKEIRLIGLCNVKLGKKAEYTGEQVKPEMQKIQWVSEKNVPIKVVMGDNSIVKCIGEPEVKKLKPNTELQLIRFGFCRVDKTKPKLSMYFTHK